MAVALLESPVNTVLTADVLRDALQRASLERRWPSRGATVCGDELPAGKQGLAAVAADLRQRIVAELLAEAELAGDDLSRSETFKVKLVDPHTNPLPTNPAEIHVPLVAANSKSCRATFGCPCCRRPVDIGINVADGMDAGATPQPKVVEKSVAFAAESERAEAYCVVLCESELLHCIQALILGQSLVASGSTKDRVLLYSPDVPRCYLDALATTWRLQKISGAWARLPGRRRFGAASPATKMFALQLGKYGKVLVMELGIVVRQNPDVIFDLDCPAAVLTTSSRPTASSSNCKSLDGALLLVQPSMPAFGRMASEIAGDGPQWPPRISTDAGGYAAGSFEDYVKLFYTSFFTGVWNSIPGEFKPLSVIDKDGPTSAEAEACMLMVRLRGWWGRVERSLVDSGSASTQTLPDAVLPIVEALRASEKVPSGLQKAMRMRCVECNASDEMGLKDPIDSEWRCRFCWESIKMQDAMHCPADGGLMNFEAEDLRRQLGAFHIGRGRQRWNWQEGQNRGWIEFRPSGVMWMRDGTMGAWEVLDRGSDRGRLAIHMRGSGGHDHAEVRHVMRRTASNGNAPSNEAFELDEVRREIFRPLGFIALPRPEKRARAWPFPAQRASPQGRQPLQGNNHSRVPRSKSPAKVESGPPKAPVRASTPPVAAVSSAPPTKTVESRAEGRSKLGYLLAKGGATSSTTSGSGAAQAKPTKSSGQEDQAAPAQRGEQKPEPGTAQRCRRETDYDDPWQKGDEPWASAAQAVAQTSASSSHEAEERQRLGQEMQTADPWAGGRDPWASASQNLPSSSNSYPGQAVARQQPEPAQQPLQQAAPADPWAHGCDPWSQAASNAPSMATEPASGPEGVGERPVASTPSASSSAPQPIASDESRVDGAAEAAAGQAQSGTVRSKLAYLL